MYVYIYIYFHLCCLASFHWTSSYTQCLNHFLRHIEQPWKPHITTREHCHFFTLYSIFLIKFCQSSVAPPVPRPPWWNAWACIAMISYNHKHQFGSPQHHAQVAAPVRYHFWWCQTFCRSNSLYTIAVRFMISTLNYLSVNQISNFLSKVSYLRKRGPDGNQQTLSEKYIERYSLKGLVWTTSSESV